MDCCASPFCQQTLGDAKQLNEQVVKLYGKAKFAEGIPLAQQALEIHERLLNPYHQDIAAILNNLALIHESMDQCGQNRAASGTAMEITKKAQGEDQPCYAGRIAVEN